MRKLVAASFVLALVLAHSPAASAAPVSVGHSGWAWGSPVPQGNELRAVEFAGARGYAAGQFGTLLRSDDSGNSWSGIATGLTSDVRRVRIVGTNSVVMVSGCSLRRSDDGGATFRRLRVVNEARCTSPISSLFFPSASVAYFVLDNGSVLRSEDGGDTVSSRTSVPGVPPGRPTDVWFTSDSTGVATTTNGQIYRTTDGAASWTLVGSAASALQGLFFADASTGYAVGSSQFMRTADGGVTWEGKPLTGASGLNFTGIRCADAMTCLLTTDTGSQLVRTTDGGETGASVTPSTQKIYGAAFASATRVVAAGSGGATVVSDDAGQNFAPVGGRLPGQYAGIRPLSATTAFAFGSDGALARTTNSGEGWSNLSAPTDEDIVDVSFATPETGFALDTTGSLLRTDNGGASWRILDTGGVRPNRVVALTKDNILLVGPRGVRMSTNGGDEFSAVTDRVIARAPLDDIDRVGNTVFAWSARILAMSTNGTTWKRLPRPSRFALNKVDFVSAKVGFVLDEDGRVWKTANQGRKWNERLSLGTSRGYDMAFSDANKGWVAVDAFGPIADHGFVFRTSDSGVTWRPQLIGLSPIKAGGLATVADTGFALGGDSQLFSTTKGGDAGTPTALKLSTKSLKLARAGSITITGKLTPAEGGEQVVVARREIGANRWAFQVATVAANGSFTTRWKVRKTAWFVAQWFGDDDHGADGSEPLRVQRGALPKPGRPAP
jgi:photosystem II stability/assembly factor-like uncharacterized protein